MSAGDSGKARAVELHRSIGQMLERHPDLEPCAGDLQAAYELLRQTYATGGKVLICGNGGSAADAEHLVGELMKGMLSSRPIPESHATALRHVSPEDGDYLSQRLQGALPTISLVSQSALLTAYSNDVDPALIFAQQVYGYGRQGDAVVGISTSGNSPNVIHALQVGRALGVATVGVTGQSGGRMLAHSDVCVRVPCADTTVIQEKQLPIYHALCIALEETFFPSGR
ncbi:MAG: SIS domain-containing protein [Chloroflexota bacterium]|nr:SIS domain-containing protein [Chloroflexota bacterium]